ncbi:MAG: sugar ABC transporter ATP-binding protein, partial [Phycisphaerae bacterium]|nr:sugar ABC transporter ATP-binding protein [Phycisphaerae bacterium]
MRAISKSFPGVRALNGVELSVRAGEVHALMGENGAGQPVAIDGPLSAKRLGIAVIYQELSLSPNLTVAENIYLGREPRKGPIIDRAAMEKGCADILARLGASFRPTTPVADLSIAERQMVE